MATSDNTKKTAQEVLADFRRQEILDAALDITIEQGRQSLTMERVAEKAGVAKGTVYLYFKEKRELILGLLDVLAGHFTAAMNEILARDIPIREKLYQMLLTTKEKSDEYRELIILINRTIGDIDECDQTGKGKYEAVYQNLLDDLQKEREKGVLKTDITNENIAHTYLSMLKGTVLIDAAHGGRLEEYGIDQKQMIDLIVRGIGLE